MTPYGYQWTPAQKLWQAGMVDALWAALTATDVRPSSEHLSEIYVEVLPAASRELSDKQSWLHAHAAQVINLNPALSQTEALEKAKEDWAAFKESDPVWVANQFHRKVLWPGTPEWYAYYAERVLPQGAGGSTAVHSP